jgi:propanol-preferring alcohol dehydrogenase
MLQCQCIKKFGERLAFDQRPDLSPEGTEVVLRVIAAGVCHTDVHLREGGYDIGHGERLEFAKRGFNLPLTLGHETVGVVEAAGPEAGSVTSGEPCLVFPWNGCGECAVCAEGKENYCLRPRFIGIHCDGGYASHVKVPHPRCLFPIGDLSPAAAAPYACSGLTTFSALKKVGDLIQTTPLVIFGAGGLGLTCMSLIKALGGPAPVVVDIDPVKREGALNAGARAAIDGAAADAVKQIQDAAGGPVPATIDFVANEKTTELSFEAAAKGGKMVLVGLYGGAAPWKLPMIPIKAVNIMGSYMGNIGEFRELMELVHQAQPIPVTEYPLADANDVLDQLEQGNITGRAVLTP